MRKPTVSKEVTDKFNEIQKQLAEAKLAYDTLANAEVQRLKAKYLNKYARTLSNPGWNKGKIWDITLSHFSNTGKIEFNFYVGPTKRNSRRFGHEQIEILTDEEAAEYEKNQQFHQKINERQLCSAKGQNSSTKGQSA